MNLDHLFIPPDEKLLRSENIITTTVGYSQKVIHTVSNKYKHPNVIYNMETKTNTYICSDTENYFL